MPDCWRGSQVPETLDLDDFQQDEPDHPTVPIVVAICTGCFEGKFQFPPWEPNGRMIDQGIDFFPDQMVVRKFHRCPKTGPGAKGKKGNWHEEKLYLTETLWTALLESKGVDQGAMRIDTFY